MLRAISTLCFCYVVQATVIAVGGPPAPDTFPRTEVTSRVLLDIDVAKRGDLLLVPVIIDDHVLNFVLDTGAVTNVLDSSVAEKLGPLQSSSRRYPEGFPPMFQLPGARIAESALHPIGEAACVDLSLMRIASGQDIGGILGVGFLSQYRIDIDFDNGKLRLLEPTSSNNENGLRISRDEFGRPLLEVELVEGKRTPMVIDTGMRVPGLGEVDQTIFTALLAADRVALKGPLGRAASLGGEMAGRKGILDRLELNGCKHRALGIREGSSNALGLDYLSRYKVTLDFPNNKLYLEKGSHFAEPTSFDMSGMAIVRIDGVTLIERVYPQGPAQESGLCARDRIVRVAGKNASAYSLLELRRLLAISGQRLDLVVERASATQEVALRLKDWQPVATKPNNQLLSR